MWYLALHDIDNFKFPKQQTTLNFKMADSSRKMHDRDQRRYRDGGYEAKLDDPPNSRLFIVCNKNITEEDFRQGFEKYGTIEEIWVVKDRATGEPKGKIQLKIILSRSLKIVNLIYP